MIEEGGVEGAVGGVGSVNDLALREDFTQRLHQGSKEAAFWLGLRGSGGDDVCAEDPDAPGAYSCWFW
jgi:hypothetical protein